VSKGTSALTDLINEIKNQQTLLKQSYLLLGGSPRSKRRSKAKATSIINGLFNKRKKW
jgi:hypothetical protein